MKKRVIIRKPDPATFRQVTFPSFDRRPSNYFRDLIAEDTEERAAPHTVADAQAIAATEVERERRKLKAAATREAEARYAEGVKRGREESAAELSAALDLLKQYAQLLLAEKAELRKTAESRAIELAIEIGREIIGAEFSIRPAAVVETVERALRSTVDASAVTLRVAADDLAVLEDAARKWMGAAGLPAQIELRADTTLRPGDCFIDSATGTVDARIESQLQHLREGLLRDHTS